MEEDIDKGCHMTRLRLLAMKPDDIGASIPYKESDFTGPKSVHNVKNEAKCFNWQVSVSPELKENTEEENQLSMNNYQENTNCENTIKPKKQIASSSKFIEGATVYCNINKTDDTCSNNLVQGSSNVTENPAIIANTLFGYMMHYSHDSRPSNGLSISAKRKRILFLVMKKCNISSLDSEITDQFYLELKKMHVYFSHMVVCYLKTLIKRYNNATLVKHLYQHSKCSGSNDMHVSDNCIDQTKVACPEKVNVPVQTRKPGRPRKWSINKTTPQHPNNDKEGICNPGFPGNELVELEPPSGQARRLFRAMSNYKLYSTRPDQSAQFKCQARVDQEKILYQVMEKFKITGLDVAPPNAFFHELTKMKKFFSPLVLMRFQALVQKGVFELKSYRPIKAKPSTIGFMQAKLTRAEKVLKTNLHLQQLSKVSEKQRIKEKYKNICKETTNALHKETNGLPILPDVSIRLIPIDQLLKFGKYANSKTNSVNIKEYLEGQHNSLCSSKKSERHCNSKADKHLKASHMDQMSSCGREKREVESNSSSTVQEKTKPDIDNSNISDVTKRVTKQHLQLTETVNTLHNITKGLAGGKKKEKQIGDSVTDNTEENHKKDKSFHIPHRPYTVFQIGKDLCGQSSTQGAEVVENKTVSPASACDKPVVEKEVHEHQQNKDHTIQIHCIICGNKLEQNSFVSHMTLQHSKWIYDKVFGISYFGPRDNLFNPKEMIFELPDVNVLTIDSNNVVSAMNVCGIDKVNGWTINKTNMFIRSGKVWFCGKMPIEKNWHDIRTFRVECTICKAIIHQTQLYSHLLKFHEHWIQEKIQEKIGIFDTSGNTISFPLPVICVSMLESGGCIKSVNCTVQELDNVVEIHNIHMNNIQKPILKKLETIPKTLPIPVVKDSSSAKNPILIDNDDIGTSSVAERKQFDNALVLPLFSSSKCYMCNRRVKPGTLWLHIKMQHIEWKKMMKSDKPLCSSKYFCTHCLKSSAEFNSLEQLFMHEISVHGTSYSCFTCGTTCHDQSEYAKHVVKHHAVLYMCEKCSLHFSSLQRLQKHTQEYHSGVVLNSESNCKLLCPHCEFCQTNAQAQLEMEHHIKTVHIRYTNQTSLTSKYQCYSCMQKFGCQAALECHQSPNPIDIKTASKECLFFNPNTRFDVYGNMIGRPDNKVSTTINDFSVTVEETGAISVTNSITGTKYHVADAALAQDIRKDLDVLNKLTELLNLYTDKRGTEYKRLVRHKNLVIKMLCRNLQTTPSQTLGQNTPEMNHSSYTSHCNDGFQQLASLPILNSSQSATLTAGKNATDVFQSSNVQKEMTHTLHRNNAFLSVSHASSCVPLVTYSPTVQDNKAVNVASSPISKSLTEQLTKSIVSIGPSTTGSHIHSKFPQVDDENSNNNANTLPRQSCATVVSTNTGYISTDESREVSQTCAQAEQANKGITGGSIIPVVKQTCVPIAGSNTPAFQTANLRSPPVLTESLKCLTQTTASTELANTKVQTTATSSTCFSPYGSSGEDVSKVFREMELKAMQRGYFSDKEVKHDQKPFRHIEHSNSEKKRLDNLKSAMKIKEHICELRKSGTDSSSEEYTSHMHLLVDFVRKELEEHNAGIIPDLKYVEIKMESESSDSHTEKVGKRSDQYVSLQSQPAFQISCAATRDVHSSSVYPNMGQTGMDQVAMSNLASLNSQPSQGNTIIINNQQGGSNTIILGNSLTSCLPPTATIFQGQNVAQQLLNQAPMSIVMNGTNLGPCQFPENVLSQTPEEMNNPPFVNTGIQSYHCAGSNLVQTENKQSMVEPVSGKSYTENVGKSLSGVPCVSLPQTTNDNTTKPVADFTCNKRVKPKFYNLLPKFLVTSQLMLPKYADVEKLNDNRGVELTDNVAVKSHVDVSKSSKVNTSIVESTTIHNKISMCEDNEGIDRCYIPTKWYHRQRGFKKRRRGKGKLLMYNTGNPDSAFKKRSSLKSNVTKKSVKGNVEISLGNTSGVKEQCECRRLLRKRKVTNYKEPDSDLSDIDDDAESERSNPSSPKHSLCAPTCQSETTEDSYDSDITELASIEDGGDEISLVIQDVRSEAFAEYESGLGNKDKNIDVEFTDSMEICNSMQAIETSKDTVSPNVVQNTHSNSLSLEDNNCVQSNINSNKIFDSNQIKAALRENILKAGAITIKSEPIDSYDSDTQKVCCDEQQNCEIQHAAKFGHSLNSEQQTLSETTEQNNYKGAEKTRVKGVRGRPIKNFVPTILSKSSGKMSAEKIASPHVSGLSHPLCKSHITSVTGAARSIAPAGNSFINTEPLNTNTHLVGSTPVQGLSATCMSQPVLMSQPIAVQQPLVQFGGSTLFNSGNQAQPLFVQNQAGTFIQQGQSQLQPLTATQQNQTLFVQPTQLPIQQQPNVKHGNQLTRPIFIHQNQMQQTATTQQNQSNHSLPTQNQIQPPNFQSLNPVQQSMFAQVQQGCAIQPTLQNQPIFIAPNQIQQTNIIQPNQNNNPLLIVQNSAQQGTSTQSQANQRLIAPKLLLQPMTSTQKQLKLQSEQQKPLNTATSVTIKQEPVSINSTLGQPVQSLSAKLPLLPQKDEMLTTLNKSTASNVNTEKMQSCQNIGNMIPASSTNTFNPLQQAMSPITTVGQQPALTPGSIVIQQGVGPQPSFMQPSVIGQQPQFIQNISCGQYVQQPVSVAMSAPQMFNIPVVNAGTQQLIMTSQANQLQMANAMPNLAVPSATLEQQNANVKLPIPRHIVQVNEMQMKQLMNTRNWSNKARGKSYTYR